MSIDNINSNSFNALQDALEAARRRTNTNSSAPKVKPTEPKRVSKDTMSVGTLYQKLYGGAQDSRPSREVVRGKHIDLYA